MSQFDQYIAMLSLEKSLVPSASLLDSRTETDNLRLLAEFASLFNFYDRTNTINGNWSPFLLKDPVFLVASISKTPFQKAYSLFINTCLQLKKVISDTSKTDFISNAFNQLFDQLSYIFQVIERWTHYTQESTLEYNLKTYIINSVKDTYGLILWSLLDLRKQLYNYQKSPHTTPNIPGIQNVNQYAFEDFDKKVWKINKGQEPYWTVLGLPMSPCKDAPEATCFYIENLTQDNLYNALYSTGKKVFSFYSKCISYADTELTTLQETPGNFPDTILLRTFTSLLKIYQKQFNSLSKKHLNFYYGDILKQFPNSVTPDTVFASSILAKKTTTFQLAKNTIFTAGVDADKQPILFETTNKVSLNPAKIANAYTVAQTVVNKYNSELYLQKLPPVNEVSKDEDGTIKTWKTFGTQLPQTEDSKTMAMAFGSPMLYLTEAESRVITLNFTFSSSTFSSILQEQTKFYLSTKKAWFEIPRNQVTLDFTTPSFTLPMTIDRNLKMTITLLQTDPAIITFAKNPDGYTSEWPLFKMLFSEFEELANPPQIKTLSIDVEVNGLQNFQLYNDFGQLNPKKPFQLLGAAPKVSQSFMIGNAEVFSKPVQDIEFSLTWNPFDPDFDFAPYYEAYNNYLNGAYSGSTIYTNELASLIKSITNSQDAFYRDVTKSKEKLFKRVLRKSKVDDAVTLIQKNQTDLKDMVDKQAKKLDKKSDEAGTLISDIKDLNNEMLTSITDIQNTLITDMQTAKKIDKDTVDTAKTNIKNEIDTTKKVVADKIVEAENKALSTNIQEKKSLLKKIRGFLGSDKKTGLTTDTTNTFQFSNTSFLVDFQHLKNGVWEDFNTIVNGETVSSSTEENLFFLSTTNTTTIPSSRTFDFSGMNLDPVTVDPTLQQQPLQLTNKTTAGFLKMKLTEPIYGFGTELYAKVVQAIALFNAEIIAEKIKNSSDGQDLVSPANIPFIPMVCAFEGNYTASVSYDFSNNAQSYPLQCFYNTPFENYKVYDTSLEEKICTKNTTFGSSPARDENGNIIPLTAIPLVPTFASKGQLYLELQDMIVPAKVSFYFELARAYTEKVLTTKDVSYAYLSTDGWKTLTSIEDSTNNFTCSGIITINIPDDIATEHITIAGNNCWIAIGTTNNPDSFPETSFLDTNGFTLQRIIAKNDYSTTIPQIAANVITTPQTAIPQIGATIQPFPSFGGKAAETNAHMNSRVSTRLKTKNRLVTMDDYFNTIRLEFQEVYYSKSIYKKSSNQVCTYVVKRVVDASDSNAFVPLLSECYELDIQKYITERVSSFINIAVENFELNYVKITGDIQVQQDEDVTTVEKEVNDGINIFLSPWITSAQSQLTIDSGLNTAQLAAFINTYDSILEINSLSFQIGTKDFSTGNITYQASTQEVSQIDGAILVPSLNNTTKNSLIKYHL
ncbi:hypothetical protein [Kordia sp.]|uniref:hypothetical protein n=1 Tax=Kordia sp. TaxID=1965332 RepID=UPI0025C156DD|nr:hypothetical protein [Kordia sp.]MCH2193461.1 hypothetical protein [Kordia sp.]